MKVPVSWLENTPSACVLSTHLMLKCLSLKLLQYITIYHHHHHHHQNVFGLLFKSKTFHAKVAKTTLTYNYKVPSPHSASLPFFCIGVFKNEVYVPCHQQGDLWPLKSTLAVLQRPLSIIYPACKKLQGFKSSTESDQSHTDRCRIKFCASSASCKDYMVLCLY